EPAPATNPRGSAVSTPASNPATAPAPASPRPTANTRRTGPDSGEQLTGWRARKAKFDARQQNNTAPSGAASGGFGGVPLPEEPDEPWDDGSPSAPPPDPEATRQAEMAEAEEAMRERDNPEATNLDHRNALEIAGELLEQHLGAERTR
ncbi:MAG: DNA polymerase III subunit gamma and tau, partial [Candidatus Corynebacterium faecigallinarum]